jgi:DNA-binding GntR family transcriptional regulator
MNELLLRTSSSLHESVRQELLRRISTGTYVPGSAIPSTAALSEEFGVSPITVKRALRDLQALGALTAVAGKGTFVKEQKRFLLALDAAESSFKDATTRLISITRERITDPTMAVFEPPGGAMLCVRKLIFFGTETPVMHDATYLSRDVNDAIVDEFGERLVTDALRRRGIDIVQFSHVIDAAPAAGQPAEMFGVPDGYPMLRRLYKLTTTEPDVTIFGIIQAPFDQLACSINTPAKNKGSGRQARKSRVRS